MAVEAVVFDIGMVLLNWDPEGAFDRAIGVERLVAEGLLNEEEARL